MCPTDEGSENRGSSEEVSGSKGAFHDFVTSTCTSGKKGTGAGRCCAACRVEDSTKIPLQPDVRGGLGKNGSQLWI